MSIELARLKAVVGAEDREFLRVMDRDTDRLNQFTRDAKRAGDKAASGLMSGFSRARFDGLKDLGGTLGLAAASAGMLAFGKQSIDTAASTREALNKVTVVFGDNAAAIKKWSKTTSDSLGQSRLDALQSAGAFGMLLHTSGVGAGQLAKMSKSLVTLSSDLASFHDLTGGAAEAAEKLRSGLVGEAEPLRAVGILLSEARVKAKAMELGLADANGELSEGAKVQARYALIMQDAGKAHGDFARTSGELKNQQRGLNAAFKDFSADLGDELVPVAKDATAALKDLLGVYKQIPEGARKFLIGGAAVGAVAGPALGGLATAATLFTSLKTAKTLKDLSGGAHSAAGTGEAAAAGVGITTAVAANARQRAFSGGSDPAVEGALRSGRAGFRTGATTVLDVPKPESRFSRLGGKLKAGGAPAGIIAQILGQLGLSFLPDAGGVGTAKRIAQGTLGGAGLGATAGSIIPGLGTGVGALAGAVIGGGNAIAGELGTLAGHRAAPGLTSRVTGKRAPLGRGAPGSPRSSGTSLLDDPEVQEARFDAMLAQAEARAAAAPESLRDRVTAREQIPVLREQQAAIRKRMAELKPRALKEKKAAEETQKLQADLAKIETDVLQLRESAAKEGEEARKRTRERFAKLRDTEFEHAQQEAELRASQAAQGMEARGLAVEMGPLLSAQAEALAAEAATEKDRDRYNDLRSKWLTIRGRIADLDANAAREEEQEEKRISDLTASAVEARAKALAGTAPEGKRAQALADNLIPALQARQEQLSREAAEYSKDSIEFQERQNEFWEKQSEIVALQTDAAKEQKDNVKKAIDEAKRAADEAAQVAEAQVDLTKARLKNAIGLSDRQKRDQLLPALKEQLRGLLTPVQGEDKLEKTKRELEAERVRGEIMGLFGAGKFAKTRYGNIPLGDLRGARAALADLGGIPGLGAGTDSNLGRQAPGGRKAFLGGVKLRMADMESARLRAVLRETGGSMPLEEQDAVRKLMASRGDGGNVTVTVDASNRGDVLTDPNARRYLHQTIDARLDRHARQLQTRPRK